MPIDPYLLRQISKFAKSYAKQEMDNMILITGETGSGKSFLAAPLCREYDPKFRLKNVAFNPMQLEAATRKAKPFSAILWDESDVGTNRREQMTITNRDMERIFNTIRYKRLLFMVLRPYLKDFAEYYIRRARCSIYCFVSYYDPDPADDDAEVQVVKGHYVIRNRNLTAHAWERGRHYSDALQFKFDHRGKNTLATPIENDWWFFDEDGGKKAYEKAKAKGLEAWAAVRDEQRKGTVLEVKEVEEDEPFLSPEEYLPRRPRRVNPEPPIPPDFLESIRRLRGRSG